MLNLDRYQIRISEVPVVMRLVRMHTAFRAGCSTDLFSILATTRLYAY